MESLSLKFAWERCLYLTPSFLLPTSSRKSPSRIFVLNCREQFVITIISTQFLCKQQTKKIIKAELIWDSDTLRMHHIAWEENSLPRLSTAKDSSQHQAPGLEIPFWNYSLRNLWALLCRYVEDGYGVQVTTRTKNTFLSSWK